MNARRKWILPGVLAAATLGKIVLALNTFGTNDVYRNELFMIWSRELGAGLYAAAWDFNHPGFIIHWLQFLGFLEDATGLPFSFWFRVHAVPADVGIVWLTWKILGRRVEEASYFRALVMLAGAPVLFLVSGFHGNTDSLMIFFVLLSVYCAQQGRSTEAGLAFGAAMCFKIVPIVALPAMLLYQDSHRRRALFCAGAAAVALAGWAPFWVQDPAGIVRQVFGYKSYYGHWGVSYLASRVAPGALNALLQQFGTYVPLVAVAAAAFWMNVPTRRAPLYEQVGLSFFLFLGLSPAFGVQYLVWLTPWVVGLGSAPAAVFFATSGVFLLLVYNYWSEGLPWYLADSNRVGDYQPHLDYFQVLCWLSILMLAWMAWKQIRLPSWTLRLLQRPAFALLLIVVLGLPAEHRLVRDQKRNRVDGRDAARTIRANTYLELAGILQRMGRPERAAWAGAASVALRTQN